MAHGVAAIFNPFLAAIDNPVLISVMLMFPEPSNNDPTTPRTAPPQSNHRLTRPMPYPRTSLLNHWLEAPRQLFASR
ncbi:hypothetical protein BD779DRAFT_1555059 [Infundibulicybe gibba]|nr:hypothetical protein BD779DRAFT_1555059 [Infundibulicybe gibba]